jgi:hypothetical protein
MRIIALGVAWRHSLPNSHTSLRFTKTGPKVDVYTTLLKIGEIVCHLLDRHWRSTLTVNKYATRLYLVRSVSRVV